MPNGCQRLPPAGSLLQDTRVPTNPRTLCGAASSRGSQAGAELLGTLRRSWCLTRTLGTAVPTAWGWVWGGQSAVSLPKKATCAAGWGTAGMRQGHTSTKRCLRRMQPCCWPHLCCPWGEPRTPKAPVPPGAQGARRNRVMSPPRCSHISFNSNIRVLNIHREIGIGSHLQCFQIHSFEVQRQIKKTLRSKIVHPCGTAASRRPSPAPCPGSRTEEQCHEGRLGLPGPREASQAQRLSGQRPCRGRVRQDGSPGTCRRTRVRAGVSPRRIFPEKKRKKYSVM